MKQKPTGPRVKDFALPPVWQAISSLRDITRGVAIDAVISRMKSDYEKGQGVDAALQEEIMGIRDWLNDLIEGISPFVVTCDVKG